MNDLCLNISNLVLRLELSGLKPLICQDLIDFFSHIISQNGHMPHETIEIVPFKKPWRTRIDPDSKLLIKKVLKIPLSKFPFTAEADKQTEDLFKDIKPFLGHARFRALLDGSREPEDVVIRPIERNGLILKTEPERSTLFIRVGYRRNPKFSWIWLATYFAASISLPLLDSILVHGAGIVRQGNGYLFLGLPNDGKTTLAGFSPPDEVIADDGIIVRMVGSNYYLDPYPFDPPFFPEDDRRYRNPTGVRLRMGFFLEKDERVWLEKVSPTKACSIILKNHIHFFRYFPPQSLKKAFDLITGLCKRIPFHVLHFRKDPSFWSDIEEASGTHELEESDYGIREKRQEIVL